MGVPPQGLSPATDLEVSSAAAGSLGFGAFFQGQWFYGSCALPQQSQSIAYKELFPMAIAAFVWGPQWCKRHVLFRSDNDAAIHMVNSRTSKIPCLVGLLRDLLLSAARHSFSFSAQHVPGINNQLADALVFIGRTSVCWLQRLSPCQLQFLHSS